MADQKKVLVVDDEEDLRTIVRLTMQSAGYAVEEARDGKEALQKVEAAQPDLMILDIMMPKMNGIEMLNKLVQREGAEKLPVIVLSAVSEKSAIVKEFMSLPLEKKHFIRKPLETTDLLRKVQEMLGDPVTAGASAPTAKPSSAASSPSATPSAAPSVAPSRPAAGSAPTATPPQAATTSPSAPAKPQPAKAPAGVGSAGTGRVEQPAAPDGASYRVLAIDDEEDIRTIIQTALSLRHTVATAENGMDALQMIDSFDPDLVISDMRMPVMNGLQTVEAIRSHPRFGGIPVFFLTGEKNTDLPKMAFERGANLFLRKPLDPMQLLKTIDYFVQETGLKPKPEVRQTAAETLDRAKGAPPKAAAPSAAPGAKPAVAPGARVRVLIVDENPDTLAVLRRGLPERKDAPWETLVTNDVRTALGNLQRWEPDAIIVNPRNLHMDGIAFVQSLKLKKLDKQFEIAFAGTEFFPADIQYSQKTLKRDVIKLSGDDATMSARLMEVVEAACPKIKPKSKSVVELHAEDEQTRKRRKADEKRHTEEREVFRKRFERIQAFIDKETA